MSLYGGKQKRFIRIKKNTKYLDELEEKIRKLDKYYHDDDFEFRGIRNMQDLFKLRIDKDNQYESKGDKILSVIIYNILA